MAEKIIIFTVLFICATPLIILGISQYKSADPVGFWTGQKPPAKEQITDVKAYNHKHGIMWILYGAGLMVCFFSMILVGMEMAMILVMIECFGGIIAMIMYHNKLERTYHTKNKINS